jgi:hypothetical protein
VGRGNNHQYVAELGNPKSNFQKGFLMSASMMICCCMIIPARDGSPEGNQA